MSQVLLPTIPHTFTVIYTIYCKFEVKLQCIETMSLINATLLEKEVKVLSGSEHFMAQPPLLCCKCLLENEASP